MFHTVGSRALHLLKLPKSIRSSKCLMLRLKFACPSASSTVMRHYSTAQLPYLSASVTSESNPIHHSFDQVGLWYTIPDAEFNSLLNYKYYTDYYYRTFSKDFGETALMIRKPALSVIHYIKQLQLDSMIMPRFLFYGHRGQGKTCSIMHVVHFLYKAGFVIVMVPWVDQLAKQYDMKPAKVVQNHVDLTMWDHTTDSSLWLNRFYKQNVANLTEMDLPVSRQYDFSSREVCVAGDHILKVAEIGRERNHLATECVVTLISELKALAADGRCKVALIIDGINSIYTEESCYFRTDLDHNLRAKYGKIKPLNFRLIRAFESMLDKDWRNSVFVGSVDYVPRRDKDRRSPLPIHNLTPEGFARLDPFVPIPVPEYTALEFESAVSYYASKNWIQNPKAITEEGKQELSALSGNNAFKLFWSLLPL